MTLADDVGFSFEQCFALYSKVKAPCDFSLEVGSSLRAERPKSLFLKPIIEILLLQQKSCELCLALLGRICLAALLLDVCHQSLQEQRR